MLTGLQRCLQLSCRRKRSKRITRRPDSVTLPILASVIERGLAVFCGYRLAAVTSGIGLNWLWNRPGLQTTQPLLRRGSRYRSDRCVCRPGSALLIGRKGIAPGSRDFEVILLATMTMASYCVATASSFPATELSSRSRRSEQLLLHSASRLLVCCMSWHGGIPRQHSQSTGTAVGLGQSASRRQMHHVDNGNSPHVGVAETDFCLDWFSKGGSSNAVSRTTFLVMIQA